MEQTLRISVTLLGDRFHGEDWPSSPARLFRALVAGSMTGSYRSLWEEVEPALRWLEGLPAPEIYASEFQAGQPFRISVPNNDMDVAAREWHAGRDYDAANLRTMKQIEPFLLEPGGPHVSYTWRHVEVDEARLGGLRHAVHSLHTLGWGIDMAFAEMGLDNDGESLNHGTRWLPAKSGEKLMPVPVAGSLKDQQETYHRFLTCLNPDGVDPDTRPSVYRLQAYTSDVGARRETAAFEFQRTDDDGSYSKPPEAAMAIAAWMRHAVSEALLQEGYRPALVNAVALGHDEEEQPGWRLSYLPLPTIGHPHADGRVRRVMIAGPSDEAEGMIRLLSRKFHGIVLTDDTGKAMCRLAATGNDRVTSRYRRKGNRWETVTPIVLHGHNASKGLISNRKTERLLLQAFGAAGFDPSGIDEITFQPAPYWPNTGNARSFKVPVHLKVWPRYHVSVSFRKPVAGPIFAGLGRHYGIGTFACPE